MLNNSHNNNHDCIDFGLGIPNTNNLPLDFLKRALKNYGENLNNSDILQYGNIGGSNSFKKSLSTWLNKKKYSKNQVNENDLFIIDGITGGLENIMFQYLNQGDVILVEDPSYDVAINIFKDFGLIIEYIPINEDGIDVEALEEKVREYSSKQKSIFLYTIPVCHNPTGCTLSHTKRTQLSAIATVYTNFYVIADEVYHFLQWDVNKEIKPMADYHINFISLGSFSKLLAPSLRVGWVYINNNYEHKIDDTTFIEDLNNSKLLKSSKGTNVFGNLIVQYAIETGFLDTYLEKNISILKENCNSIIGLLSKSDIFKYTIPTGGYFIWLESLIDSENIIKEANKYKVNYKKGSDFSDNNTMNNCLRLSYSHYEKETLELGITRLLKCFEDFNKIKLGIIGHKGKLGSSIVKMINKEYAQEYIIVCTINREDFKDNKILNSLKNVDVIIDVSSTTGTIELINYLNDNKLYYKPILSSTTNHSEENISKMRLYSKNKKFMNINNFSKGIPVLKNIINIINELPSDWVVKIHETIDTIENKEPSYTAKMLDSLVTKECIIESIHETGNHGNLKIICSNDYESIELSHQALDYNLFVNGCIEMIPELLREKTGFVTDLNLKNSVDSTIDSTIDSTVDSTEIYNVDNYNIFINTTIGIDYSNKTKELCTLYNNLDGVETISNIKTHWFLIDKYIYY